MDNKKLKSLIISIVVIALIGYGAAFASILITSFDKGIFQQDFCFSDDCIGTWIEAVSNSLLIAKSTSELLLVLAAVGASLIALSSYISNVNSTSLSNHIEHFSLFREYLISEVKRLDRINNKDINISIWYGSIFPDSRLGKLSVSNLYKEQIIGVNEKIEQSNEQKDNSMFLYKPHQELMKEQLDKMGISIARLPRVDFYEVESQVLALITAINTAFCQSDSVPRITERKYL